MADPASMDSTVLAHNCPAGTASKADLDPELQPKSSSAADSSVFPSPVRQNPREKALELHLAMSILAVRLLRLSSTDWDREVDRRVKAE